MQTYYITTPIYYVNDVPHLGHVYTTVAADVLARQQRMAGKDVFFLTGIDEHGQKVQQAAEQRQLEPIELADEMVAHYQQLWPRLHISHDDFIRTSSERHKQVVQWLWRRLQDKGAIYKGTYEDWYCVPCETYWTETQLKEAGYWDEALCPDCRRGVEKVEEESYFFRLSDYQQPLLDYFAANPDFVAPESRRNEVLRFIESGLHDLSISRSTFSWGVPVPGDDKHVVYVWIDALSNYLSALGFPDGDRAAYWPASLHLIGKDILRFHAIYWPCMLLAADLPLPERVFAHGWWTVEGEKMSKSKGNVIRPNVLLDEVDADAVRYFLLREVPFGNDGDFSRSALAQRYNSELANDVGNLLNRSLAMLKKYRASRLTACESKHASDLALRQDSLAMQTDVTAALDRQAFHEALERINKTVRHGNRYVEEQAPWKLAKAEDDQRLDAVLYHLVESLRLISLQLLPFMPVKAKAMLEQIQQQACDGEALRFATDGQWGGLPDQHECAAPSPIFPRMEIKKIEQSH